LNVTNAETDQAKTVELVVDGNLSVPGTTTITAGSVAGANSTLTLAGSTVGSGGNWELNDNTGLAILTLDGSGLQTVSGAINGDAIHEGTLNVEGTAGTLFNHDIGSTCQLLAVNITAGAGTTAEFDGKVNADTITMSGLGIAKFDGAVNDTAAGTRNLNLTSLGEVELNADGNVFGTITISGAGTLDINGSISCTATNFTADGTIDLAAGKNFGGKIDNTSAGSGVGTLNVEGTSAISGTVGETNALKLITGGAAGSVATFDAAVRSEALTVNGTGTVRLDGASTIGTTTFSAAGTLDLNATLTGDIVYQAAGTVDLLAGSNITGGITTNADDQGILTLSGAGAQTISGAVGSSALLDLATITKSGTGTATFNSAVFANALNITAAGTVDLDVLSTIATTTITAAGTLNLDGGLSGTVALNAAGATVTVSDGANIGGAVTANAANQGVVTFAGASTLGGALGVVGANELADVNINGGVVSAAYNIAATTIDVANNAALRLTGNITTEGTLATAAAANAAINFQGYTLTHTGDMTFGADSDLNLDLTTSTLSFGKATVSGTLTLPADVDITVNVIGTSYVAGGTTFLVIDGAAGAGVVGGNTVTDNSFVLSFTAGTDAANRDLILTATRANSYTNATTGGNTGAAAAALEQAGKDGATGDMATVLATLDGMGSAAEINTAISTMTPDVSSGAAEASRAATTNSFTMISNRLGGARTSGSAGSGVSSGETMNGVGVWIQGLGSHMKQDERKGIEGYKANLFGTTIGVDRLIDKHFRLGLAGSYGWARVNSKQPGSPSDDINSFQGTLYGSYDSLDLCEARKNGKNSREAVRNQGQDFWYVDGMVAFTQNNYDSRREIWLTPTNKRVAKADHYGQQYSTNFEGGYTFTFEDTKALEVTPFAGLGYNFLYMNKYKEKGADALNLRVDGEGFHQLEQSLGMKLAYPLVSEKMGTFIPSVKAAWLYDYIGDRFETTASFAGGGPSFETQGAKPAKNGMLFGAELAFLNKGNVTVSGNWDIELKDQFVSNTYYGTVRYDF
jgi:outer membrane autotransporter protein